MTAAEQVREARRVLQEEVAQAVGKFMAETGGFEIESINVELSSHYSNGVFDRQIVMDVEVELKV